jgi:hypothetical protein
VFLRLTNVIKGLLHALISPVEEIEMPKLEALFEHEMTLRVQAAIVFKKSTNRAQEYVMFEWAASTQNQDLVAGLLSRPKVLSHDWCFDAPNPPAFYSDQKCLYYLNRIQDLQLKAQLILKIKNETDNLMLHLLEEAILLGC